MRCASGNWHTSCHDHPPEQGGKSGEEKRTLATNTRRCEMNWDVLKGQWNQFLGRLRSKWGKLTDDDWTVIGGKKDVLLGKLQERYGYKKDEAEKEVDNYLKTL
jgi:uncharacterized protein YjbJ (UPF0337 family)